MRRPCSSRSTTASQAVRAGKRLLDACGLQTGLGGKAGQDFGRADVEPLLEVGVEQPVDDGVLTALAAGLPDQPMRQPRVGRALHAIEGEVDPDLAADLRHVAVEFGATLRAELARPIHRSARCLRPACPD